MDAPGLQHELRIRLNSGGRKCFGPGIAQLLRLSHKYKSLRAAAKDMGMAYSKAHRVVKECEDALGLKLLNLKSGGPNGGGAQLTADGQQILQAYDKFCNAVNEAADVAFGDSFSFLLYKRKETKEN